MTGVREALASSLNYRGKLVRALGIKRPEIDLYLTMRADYRAAPSAYQAGRFWRGINAEFEDFLWAGAQRNLRNEYFNRRFAGPDPCSRQVWRALLWLYYQRLRERDSTGFLAYACEPSVGGTADQELIDGRPMSLDFLQSVDEVYQIWEAWQLAGRPGRPQVIVELGAGYGRLAYVMRQMAPESTYVILDLPEALSCAASWLARALPADAVAYVSGQSLVSLSREVLLSRRVWLLGAYQIERIDAGAVDAFVNIYSFAEMPPAAIENYFAQIDRITRGVFYSKQRKIERNSVDRVRVSEHEYPVRPGWSELFHRTTPLYEAFFEAAYQVRCSSV